MVETNNTRTPKDRSKLVFWRIYFFAALILWNGYGLAYVSPPFFESFQDPEKLPHAFESTVHAIIPLVACMPLVVPVILSMFGLLMFKSGYSCLGKYQRTPFPSEKPIASFWGKGRFGWVAPSGPVWKWHVYPDGVGVHTIFGAGKVFIKKSDVEYATGGSGLFGDAKFHVNHTELRGRTMHVPSRVATALRKP